jgi:hypothetical protein
MIVYTKQDHPQNEHIDRVSIFEYIGRRRIDGDCIGVISSW